MTVVTVAVVTVVIVTYFRRRKKIDTSTTDEMFSVQLFAILAMFYTLVYMGSRRGD